MFSKKLSVTHRLDTANSVTTLDDWEYVTASDLNIGDYLLVSNSRNGSGVVPSRITSITITSKRGVFNPHTRNGAIIVDGVVASEQTAFVPKWAAGNAFHRGLLKALKIGFSVIPRCFDAPISGIVTKLAGHSSSDAIINRDIFEIGAVTGGMVQNSIYSRA
jgi:hypothetical protein